MPYSIPGIVFEDAELRAIFHPAPAEAAEPWLLVTFAPLDMTPNGLRFWGEKVAARAGVAALGIVPTRPNWYPATSVGPLCEAIRPLLAGFREIVTYGASMGGYAALKYGTALGAGTAIAICPQASIDPADLAPVQSRYAHHFQPALHVGMRVAPCDLPARSHILFDPFDPHDDRQAALLRDVAPEARLTRVPMTGHDTIHVFAGAAIAAALIETCRQDDAAALHALATKHRRVHWLRLATTARMAALRGRTALARGLLEGRGGNIPALHLSRLHGVIADRLLRQGRATEAGWFIDQLESLSPEHPRLAALRRDLAIAEDHRDAALIWARRAAEAPGANHQPRLALAQLLLRAGQMAEAGALIGALHAERPSDARIVMAMADLARKRGDHAGELAWVSRGAVLEPGWVSIRRRLAALHAQGALQS